MGHLMTKADLDKWDFRSGIFLENAMQCPCVVLKLINNSSS